MKVSIRFFDDKEIRAFWNDENSRWYFSVLDSDGIVELAKKSLLQNALTDKIADREMFMKGIDYSYYYEEQL